MPPHCGTFFCAAAALLSFPASYPSYGCGALPTQHPVLRGKNLPPASRAPSFGGSKSVQPTMSAARSHRQLQAGGLKHPSFLRQFSHWTSAICRQGHSKTHQLRRHDAADEEGSALLLQEAERLDGSFEPPASSRPRHPGSLSKKPTHSAADLLSSLASPLRTDGRRQSLPSPAFLGRRRTRKKDHQPGWS